MLSARVSCPPQTHTRGDLRAPVGWQLFGTHTCVSFYWFSPASLGKPWDSIRSGETGASFTCLHLEHLSKAVSPNGHGGLHQVSWISFRLFLSIMLSLSPCCSFLCHEDTGSAWRLWQSQTEPEPIEPKVAAATREAGGNNGLSVKK